MLHTEPAWISALRHALVRLDGFMSGLSLLLLLALILGQVLLRNLLDTGIPNADILSRYLVLYITFFGAALAIETHRHIRIDIVAAFLTPERLRRITPPLYLLSAGICALMAWAAMRFWYDDWQYVAAHERWSSILALITPFGFCLLTVHFLLGALYLPPPDERR
jgi:TRAP-type C4-dicarboxylate transport system permease small subunit